MKNADALTKKEFDLMRREFSRPTNKKEVRNRAIFELLFTMGLRVSDLLNLRVRDVFKRNGEVKDAFTTIESKKDRFRGVVIMSKPKEALQDWMEVSNHSRDDYIFPSPVKENQPVSRWQVNNIIKDKVEVLIDKYDRQELKDRTISSHSGRKTMGRRLRKNGFEISKISEWLGHKNKEVTQRYIGIFDKDLKEMIMSLED